MAIRVRVINIPGGATDPPKNGFAGLNLCNGIAVAKLNLCNGIAVAKLNLCNGIAPAPLFDVKIDGAAPLFFVNPVFVARASPENAFFTTRKKKELEICYNMVRFLAPESIFKPCS